MSKRVLKAVKPKMSRYIKNYYCFHEGIWIPKENALPNGQGKFYCPSCHRFLRLKAYLSRQQHGYRAREKKEGKTMKCLKCRFNWNGCQKYDPYGNRKKLYPNGCTDFEAKP